VAAQAEGKERACGLFCPSEVAKIAEATRSRKSIYDFYGLRVEFGGDGSAWFEIVDEKKRLAAQLDSLMVDELYRAMLDEAGGKLFGTERPTMTAIYTLKALRDISAEWLRSAEERRRELEKRLRDAEEKAKNYMELKREADEAFKRYQELLRRLDEECGEDTACRAEMSRKLGVEKAWEKYNELARKMDSLRICRDYTCSKPTEYAKHLKHQLRDTMEAERRLRIAALALSHTWRALTHPTIDDLEQLYVIPSSGDGSGPLDQFMQKAAKAGVVQ